MNELEETWRKLALTEQEQDVVEIEPEDTNLEEEDKFFLVGTLWSNRTFNNQALISLMKTLWRPRKGIDVDVISDNRFLFTLYAKGDVERIMEGCPWMFDKHILLMQHIHNMEQPSKVILQKAIFWMRIYDLPLGVLKEGVIEKIGSKAGTVLALGHRKNHYIGGRYVRVRVEVDVRHPLARGTQLQIRGRPPMFIAFKYERLQHFCYTCGRLGHTDRDCEAADSPDLPNQYSDHIRASPETSRGR